MQHIVYNEQKKNKLTKQIFHLQATKHENQQLSLNQIEDYFSKENYEKSIDEYNTFLKLRDIWMKWIFIPFGFQNKRQQNLQLRQINNHPSEEDIYKPYHDQFFQNTQSISNDNQEYIIQIDKKPSFSTSILCYFGQIQQTIMIIVLSLYFLEALLKLKNFKNIEISIMSTSWRLAALVQFIIFSQNYFFDEFIYLCKVMCYSCLIMFKNSNIQNTIIKNCKFFVYYSYCVLFIQLVPYGLNMTIGNGLFSQKYNQSLQNFNQVQYFFCKILLFCAHFLASCAIIFPVFCILQIQYVIWLVYGDFFQKAYNDWFDDDTPVNEFLIIENIHISIGYTVQKLDNLIKKLTQVSFFFITLLVIITSYIIQQFIQQRNQNVYDWLQLGWTAVIQYLYFRLLSFYPQKIHDISIKLSKLLKSRQANVSDVNQQKFQEFGNFIAENPINFSIFNFPLTTQNIQIYYITLTYYVTNIFTFKNYIKNN